MICKAGIARTSIRCSDYKRGIALAEEINNPIVYQECASILEEMKVCVFYMFNFFCNLYYFGYITISYLKFVGNI